MISGVLLLLAMNPTIQDKVFTELNSIFALDGDEVDEKMLSQLVYLDMVIKESLRLLPPVLVIVRQAQEDIKLSKEVIEYTFKIYFYLTFYIAANYIAPKGTLLSFFILKTHTDKRYWGEDALKFDPERFSTENLKKIIPYSYIPFSKGYRICPGYHYGLMTIKLFLSKFLLKYQVSTDLKYEKLKFIFSITTVIEQGFMVVVKKR